MHGSKSQLGFCLGGVKLQLLKQVCRASCFETSCGTHNRHCCCVWCLPLQSAAVLALSRLVFEFAGQLEGVVGRLLPAVLLLLRSHSREVIKAVLGFIKVRLTSV